jgi:hypothetical protein
MPGFKNVSHCYMGCHHQYSAKTSLYIWIYHVFFAEPSDLGNLVDENLSSNFFIDEAPVAGEKFSTETLADISKKVSRNNYLWIACQSDKAPHKRDANFEGSYRMRPKTLDCTLKGCRLFKNDQN